MDCSELSRALAARTEDIASMLLPKGKRHGQYWRAGNANGDEGESLALHLTGDSAGKWVDYESGEHGDLLDLWMKSRALSITEAMKAAHDWLGVEPKRFTGSRPRQYRKPERPQAKRPSAVQAYLSGRGISEETIRAYQVGEMQSSDGPLMVLPFKRNGELLNIKYMPIEREADGSKKKPRFEAKCELLLWGWHTIPDTAREVLLSEGEIDAMTWHDCGAMAMSVPNGANGHTWIENEFDNLERFETIYLSFDMDAPGRAAVAELIDRLGRHRCRVVKLPQKDANDCIRGGVTKDEMLGFLASAETCDPEELKRASAYVEEVIDLFYPTSEKSLGFKSPWRKLDDFVRFRSGELSLWSGFSGHGKSQLLNQVMLAGMAEGERCCIASLELKPAVLLKRMTRQATGLRQPASEIIRGTHCWYDGRLWIFDLVGQAKVSRLMEVFDYARRRYGVTQFVTDSLLRCGIAEDDYNAQKAFADTQAEFATTHSVGMHLVAHSRKKQDDHHAGGKLDIRGTAAISDLAHNVYIVWRNKEKEQQVNEAIHAGIYPSAQTLEKPDALFICDKTREGEWEGSAKLWFDKGSLQFIEDSNPALVRPMIFDDYPERYEEPANDKQL